MDRKKILKKEFKKNYTTARQVKHWEDKSPSEKRKLKKIAEEYNEEY